MWVAKVRAGDWAGPQASTGAGPERTWAFRDGVRAGSGRAGSVMAPSRGRSLSLSVNGRRPSILLPLGRPRYGARPCRARPRQGATPGADGRSDRQVLAARVPVSGDGGATGQVQKTMFAPMVNRTMAERSRGKAPPREPVPGGSHRLQMGCRPRCGLPRHAHRGRSSEVMTGQEPVPGEPDHLCTHDHPRVTKSHSRKISSRK